jgi:transposase InsO family protein
MCRIFRVSRSSYYKWCSRDIEDRVDEELNNLIKEIFESSYQTYGTRRIKQSLLKEYGLIVSRRKIAKIMLYCGLRAKTKSDVDR